MTISIQEFNLHWDIFDTIIVSIGCPNLFIRFLYIYFLNITQIKNYSNKNSKIIYVNVIDFQKVSILWSSIRATSKETFDVTKRLIFSGRNRFSRFTAMCQADCLRLIVKVSTLKADVLKFPQILIRSRAPFNESRETIQKKKLTWKIRSLTNF